MKKGCLLFLLLWGTLTFVAFKYFEPTIEFKPALIAGLISGLLATFALGSIRNIFHERKEAALIEQSARGAPLRDGSVIAVSGRIEAISEPLQAPFSHKPCVLYSYDIYQMVQVRRDKSWHSEERKSYSGFYLTPCVIRGMSGEVKLLGFPVLEGFGRDVVGTPEAAENAKTYLRSKSLEKVGMSPRAIYRVLREVLTDSDGQISMDWRLDGEEDISGMSLAEEIVEHGEEVVAIGLYSQQYGGIVPDIGNRGVVNRLYRGKPQDVAPQVRGKISTHIFLTILFAALSTLLVPFILKQYGKSRDVQDERRKILETAIKNGDLRAAEQIFERGVLLNQMQENGQPMSLATKNERMLRLLISKGVDINWPNQYGQTPLMLAASERNSDAVRLLLRVGADLERKDNWGGTALQYAIDRNAEEIVTILKQAGAIDTRITQEDGLLVLGDEKDGPFQAVLDYLAAIHAGDEEKLRSFATKNLAVHLKDIDFALWHNTRPLKAELIEGYKDDRRASLQVGGVTGGGYSAVWNYQLELEDGSWKVARERDAAR